MPDTPRDTRRGVDGWETVAHHNFEGVAELDATIATTLDDSGPEQPLYGEHRTRRAVPGVGDRRRHEGDFSDRGTH